MKHLTICDLVELPDITFSDSSQYRLPSFWCSSIHRSSLRVFCRPVHRYAHTPSQQAQQQKVLAFNSMPRAQQQATLLKEHAEAVAAAAAATAKREADLVDASGGESGPEAPPRQLHSSSSSFSLPSAILTADEPEPDGFFLTSVVCQSSHFSTLVLFYMCLP